jgi:CheY-like chemotaxis protein
MLLIVDDDPAFLMSAEKQLNEGRGVFFAGNASDAKALIRSVGSDFSVVMVDLDLPGEDGFSLIGDLRRNFPDLPLIAISGVFQKDALESAKVFGAKDALQKPITPEWKAAIARARRRAA